MSIINIKSNYKLSGLTSFKIGGRAEYFYKPGNIDEVISLFEFAVLNGLKITVMGGGTNLLISDKGVSGLVICSGRLNKITVNDTDIRAESGVSILDLNKAALKYSLSGLEFSNGLPGSAGGAVFMNARSYGREFSEIIEEVRTVSFDGQIRIFNKDQLDYSYKKSLFMKNEDLFIFSVKFRLQKGNYNEIKIKKEKNFNDRRIKKQFTYPSAGCVFKNNYDKNLIAGKLIDDLGLKGLKYGGAQIAVYHGNFFINKNNATADDVKKLIETAEKKAFEEKGVKLERELKLIGFE